MTEWRRHPRFKELIHVRWSTGFLGTHGHGIIRNISFSGIMLEVDGHFKAMTEGDYRLDIVDAQLAQTIPSEVRLVWSEQHKTNKLKKLCGMKYTHVQGPNLTRLAQYIEQKRLSYDQAMDINIIKNYLSQSN